MIKIKPCPFCAGVNVYPAYANQPATYFYCKCLDCGANGPKIERQIIQNRTDVDERIEYIEAAEQWNQRASTIIVEVKHGPYDEIYELGVNSLT